MEPLPTGDFGGWLRHVRRALLTDEGTNVDCRGCNACCSSSLFIHVRPEETQTLDRIDRRLLVPAPDMPRGHVLLGYDKDGRCPMLAREGCSIYEHRPSTCRSFDCRIFGAAGVPAGGPKQERISQRAQRFRFDYPTSRALAEHAAVKAAAKFIRDHAECFPGRAVPSNPSQLAILALKSYTVFLDRETTQNTASDQETADAIVQACRQFDAQRREVGRSTRGGRQTARRSANRQVDEAD